MSPAIFRAADILGMAVQIERQGIAFYGTCMDWIDSSELKDTFAYLIAQERVHLDLFSDMKKSSGELELPESYPGESQSHMAAFVRDRVFSTPEKAHEAARGLGNALEAVDLAVGFEEKSIAFYNFAKERVRDSDRASIERIVREEQRHIDRLNDLRRKLAG